MGMSLPPEAYINDNKKYLVYIGVGLNDLVGRGTKFLCEWYRAGTGEKKTNKCSKSMTWSVFITQVISRYCLCDVQARYLGAKTLLSSRIQEGLPVPALAKVCFFYLCFQSRAKTRMLAYSTRDIME